MKTKAVQIGLHQDSNKGETFISYGNILPCNLIEVYSFMFSEIYLSCNNV